MKKNIFLILALTISLTNTIAQDAQIDKTKITEDFNQLLGHLSQFYVYGKDKKVDFDCLVNSYKSKIENIKTTKESLLFFEYFLDEFYDNHLTLNTNNSDSYRLWAPIYLSLSKNKVFVTNVWQTQIEMATNENIIGAELLKFNQQDISTLIENFPTHCHDKKDLGVREWIANKIIAGRYNETRLITLKLRNGKTIELDLDQIQYKEDNTLLTSKKIEDIGVIRINNSLGKDELVLAFDKVLDSLMNTKALILDLRNTVDGGDAYEARGIMGRFIKTPKPYQKHSMIESVAGNPNIERSWVEYVTPRQTTYTKPVLILVGRWTGSMGEGLAIGFEGIGRAKVVGTEMERLAGEIFYFQFKNQSYGYRIPAAKLFHINGTLREEYVPTHYVKQRKTSIDEVLNKGIELINEQETTH